ncbi:MAG: bacteriorhodopsin, partial [Pseudomonadota bacterium]|nr:bacteriorhodopsin [Pseudomonadota bacterium]
MTTILKNWKTAAAAAVFAMMPTLASAANLQADDYVGISFWLISIAMVASTVFFYAEARRIGGKWGVSLLVAALVTLVAAVHYFYMREVWVTTGESPTVYRYIDWLITVPLQMVEFYLILFAVGAATSRIFWHLLVGTLVMLLGGYFGEIGVVDATLGFIVGMVGWVYILYFIFAGEAGQKAAAAGGAVASAFSTMRLIVL